MSELKIKVKAFCTPPTLNSVAIVSTDTVSFSWNNNAILYTSGSALLEMSVDGGATWTTLATVPINPTNYSVKSVAIGNISNGQSVRFRMTINGTPCTNMVSNVITQTWAKPATIYITDKVGSQSAGSTTYKLHVEGATFVGYANVAGRKGSNLKTAFVRISGFGNDLSIPRALAVGETIYNSTAVTIPVGVYDCIIYLQGMAMGQFDEVIMDGAISYGNTSDYYSGTEVNAEATLLIPPISQGEGV